MTQPDPEPTEWSITVVGVLDAVTTMELRRQLLAVIAARGPQVVGCDVAGVLGPDLAMVGGLAGLALSARRAGASLRLLRPPPELCELLARCGLSELFGLPRPPT